MNKIIILSFILSSYLIAQDLDPLKSAARKDGETFKQIISQYRTRGKITVLGQKAKFEKLDFSYVTEWRTKETLKENFEYVRDKRFLKSSDQSELQRRSTWLYPDNGCYARASMMIQNLKEKKVKKPWKVFIFGNLKVETDNSLKGYVKWWYHVVPIVTVDDEPYVLDPAIDPSEALSLKDWALRQIEDLDEVTFSICGPNAYSPSSNCLDFEDPDMKKALRDQERFLPMEWSRQEKLERDPYEVLGDNPPWLN